MDKCVPRLRKLGNLLTLKLGMCGFPEALVEAMMSVVVRACPRLTQVCLSESVTLAQLSNLRRVEIRSSKCVTYAGVLALALTPSMESIHLELCASFERSSAERVMREVQRPYLDIQVVAA